MIGSSLSHFEITSKLGEGGMGAVYQATDTKLSRQVAIKVLPQEFTADAERLARFERESRVLASLSHARIAGIYEVGEQEETHFLVMELAEGEDLAERIARGPVPIDEATKIAIQIAEGLEAAHANGIIHRDLKPANVKVDADGNVRILDFGLAKAWADDGGTGGDLANSPTLTHMTQAGVLMGTAAYMSPEQARGLEADQRADVWALGVVLWEMLTGKQLFDAGTMSDTLVGVLSGDISLAELPEETPLQLREVLTRTLERDRTQRLHAAADARILLQESLSAPSFPAEAAEEVTAKKGLSPAWVLPGLVTALAIGWFASAALRPAPEPAAPVRTTLQLPAGERLRQGWNTNLDISSDGRYLAFATFGVEKGQVYLRDLSTYEAVAIDGSKGGKAPFFSPDGEWLAFFAEGKLKKVSTRGGASLPICDAVDAVGGTWVAAETIVFSDRGSLFRIDPAGGEPVMFASPDLDADEDGFLRPAALPGANAVAFVIDRGAGTDADEIGAITLDGERRVSLARNSGGQPRSIPGNRLLIGRSTGLLVLGLDPETLAVTSEPVWALPGANEYQYAVSGNGTLIYQRGAQREPAHLFAVDRSGQSKRLTREPRGMRNPRVSPSGDKVLVTLQEDEADLWIFDRTRSTLTRLTTDEGEAGIWSPDGSEIIYLTYNRSLRARNSDGSGTFRPIRDTIKDPYSRRRDSFFGPDSITPDGKAVFVSMPAPETLVDIWLYPLDGSEPRAIIETPANEASGVISPDGNFLAYVSDATGRSEVYVQDYRASGARFQISAEGGEEPVWARDMTELFFRRSDAIYSVPVSAGATFSAGAPELLFSGYHYTYDTAQSSYDVTPEGDGFIMLESQREGWSSLLMVQNWADHVGDAQE